MPDPSVGQSVCRHSFTWTTSTTGAQTPPDGYMTWCGACGTWGCWEGAGWRAMQESPGSLAMEQAERFGDALSRIFAILGPAAPDCEGCAHEIGEAVAIIREVHGV